MKNKKEKEIIITKCLRLYLYYFYMYFFLIHFNIYYKSDKILPPHNIIIAKLEKYDITRYMLDYNNGDPLEKKRKRICRLYVQSSVTI
jgi:hypothetical protein